MSVTATGNIRTGATSFARLATRGAAFVLAAGLLAGCSAVPDWANPMSDSSSTPPAATTGEGASQFPDLANVPEKAPETTSLADQKGIADGLVADREAARHSDEVLRGGTEAPAPAPVVAKPTPMPELKDVAPATKEKQSMYEKAPVLNLPQRGGHATLEGAKRMAAADATKDDKDGAVTEVDDPAVRGAPTTKVEVQPAETAKP